MRVTAACPRSRLDYGSVFPLLFGKGSPVNAPPKITPGRYMCIFMIQSPISSGDPNEQNEVCHGGVDRLDFLFSCSMWGRSIFTSPDDNRNSNQASCERCV